MHSCLICISDWVLLLGPETFGDEGLYEYAVVSNERRGALLVLARDVPGFRAEYQEEVCFLTVRVRLNCSESESDITFKPIHR